MYFTINEFIDLTGLSRITLYRWDKQGILPMTRINNRILYTEETYQYYLNAVKPNRIGVCRNTFIDLSDGVTKVLTLKGEEFFVSTSDVEKLRATNRTWGAMYIKDTNLFYPILSKFDGVSVLKLHNYLLQPPKGYEVDHIDRVPMNCCRDNLRVVTKSENCYNRRVPSHKSYELPKGVTKVNSGYIANITVNGKRKYLGFSKDPEEAIKLRREAENKYLKGVIL